MCLPPSKSAITTLLGSGFDAPDQDQSEDELFRAKGEEIARKARWHRIVRIGVAVGLVWNGLIGRIFRPAVEARQKQQLIERLKGFPPYLLDDIGVVRDDEGRFIYEDDLGLPVDIATGARPATPSETAGMPTRGRVAGVAGE